MANASIAMDILLLRLSATILLLMLAMDILLLQLSAMILLPLMLAMDITSLLRSVMVILLYTSSLDQHPSSLLLPMNMVPFHPIDTLLITDYVCSLHSILINNYFEKK